MQQSKEQNLLKEYFQLSSTIFATNSPKEMSEIKSKLWEIRREIKAHQSSAA
ncbi:MAG: hypothetical protein AAGI07_07850 [Bacteroidota bacterium]